MADQSAFLLRDDPKRFWNLVANEDSRIRAEVLAGSFDDIVLCEIFRLGIFGRDDMVAPLMRLYEQLTTSTPPQHRVGLLGHVVGAIEHTNVVSIGALMPFITEDPSHAVVAAAVIDYVSLGPLVDNDPMSRVKEIAVMIEQRQVANTGAAFGGLLHMGDARICKVLLPLRDGLDGNAVEECARCGTGVLHSDVVDFYLSWLEGMDATPADGIFGTVVAALINLKRSSRTNAVATGLRPIPARGVTKQQWDDAIKWIPLDSFLRQITPRLIALERTEPTPRIVPHIMSVWGIEPHSQPDEIAPLPKAVAAT